MFDELVPSAFGSFAYAAVFYVIWAACFVHKKVKLQNSLSTGQAVSVILPAVALIVLNMFISLQLVFSKIEAEKVRANMYTKTHQGVLTVNGKESYPKNVMNHSNMSIHWEVPESIQKCAVSVWYQRYVDQYAHGDDIAHKPPFTEIPDLGRTGDIEVLVSQEDIRLGWAIVDLTCDNGAISKQVKVAYYP